VKSIKAQAKERDRHRCLACGSRKNLTIDHIYPKSWGGGNVLENYQTLCQPCNGKKNDTVIDFISMSMVQKRLWLLENFGPDWREILGVD
jgi:5-methylcytosine-specific restriction endonuclease McrA